MCSQSSEGRLEGDWPLPSQHSLIDSLAKKLPLETKAEMIVPKTWPIFRSAKLRFAFLCVDRATALSATDLRPGVPE